MRKDSVHVNKNLEEVMSKMNDWVLELEQDKINLTREQFIQKHSEMFAYIYDEQLGLVPEPEEV